MNFPQLVTVLGIALVTATGCKGPDRQVAPDATVEPARYPPTPPTDSMVPPPPSPPVDAAVERNDVVADAAGAAPARSARTRRKAAPAKSPRGGGESSDGGSGLSTMSVTGNLPKAVADEVLRAKAASFATCHAAEDGQPAIHGQLQVKLTMDDRGVVEIAKVVKSSLGGGDAELCVARVARRFKFPPPPGGGESSVTFQLKF